VAVCPRVRTPIHTHSILRQPWYVDSRQGEFSRRRADCTGLSEPRTLPLPSGETVGSSRVRPRYRTGPRQFGSRRFAPARSISSPGRHEQSRATCSAPTANRLILPDRTFRKPRLTNGRYCEISRRYTTAVFTYFCSAVSVQREVAGHLVDAVILGGADRERRHSVGVEFGVAGVPDDRVGESCRVGAFGEGEQL